MADFCNKCSEEHGFNIDIDIAVEFKPLKNGELIQVICEGCAMLAVGKDDDGKCVVFFGMLCPVVERRSKWFYYDIDTNTIGEEHKQLNEDNDE